MIWQYHDAGRRAGVNGPVDLNVFRGSGLFLQQVSPAIRLAVAPATGHLVNLEEPDLRASRIEGLASAWHVKERRVVKRGVRDAPAVAFIG